jgi:hypothetical protein
VKDLRRKDAEMLESGAVAEKQDNDDQKLIL